MRFKKILFPTDFSDASKSCLGYAAALAAEEGAKLIILHVHEPPVVQSPGTMPSTLESQQDAARLLEAIALPIPGVRHERRLAVGDPATEIVRIAEHEHVNLIVMATHGRTGLSRLLMGSVAEAVVRNAPCPVMTFRDKSAQVASEPAEPATS